MDYSKALMYKIVLVEDPTKLFYAATVNEECKDKINYHFTHSAKTNWSTPLGMLMQSRPRSAFKIELVEKYPCKSRLEMKKRVDELVAANPSCLNEPRSLHWLGGVLTSRQESQMLYRERHRELIDALSAKHCEFKNEWLRLSKIDTSIFQN